MSKNSKFCTHNLLILHITFVNSAKILVTFSNVFFHFKIVSGVAFWLHSLVHFLDVINWRWISNDPQPCTCVRATEQRCRWNKIVFRHFHATRIDTSETSALRPRPQVPRPSPRLQNFHLETKTMVLRIIRLDFSDIWPLSLTLTAILICFGLENCL